MCRGPPGAILYAVLGTGSAIIDAERAFVRAARARRFAALARRLRRAAGCGALLPVYDERALAPAGAHPGGGLREIPLCAIRGTLEPSPAAPYCRRSPSCRSPTATPCATATTASPSPMHAARSRSTRRSTRRSDGAPAIHTSARRPVLKRRAHDRHADRRPFW